MIKKLLVTLLVTVDTEDEEICPTGDPTRIDKNKKVLDQVWDIAQNYKLIEKDDDRFLQTIQIWSKLSTRFKKL